MDRQGSGAIGPWIVTADEIPDPYALRIETRPDGELRVSLDQPPPPELRAAVRQAAIDALEPIQ